MKLTLLEIVQATLNDMDSFEVSSINDTVESAQVARIVKDTFYDLVNQRNWASHFRTIQLGSGTASKPTHSSIPAKVKEISTVMYNKRTSTDTRDKYSEVQYLYPDEFLRKTNDRDSSATNVDTVTDTGGIDLLILNDSAPTYWTSFTDKEIVFDSYNSDVDSFIQNSKTQVLAYVEPTWSMTDTAYPDLPEEAFPLLLNEVKSRAFYLLKQMPNEKAEQESTRQRRRMSRKDWQAHGGVRYPNYGRRSLK